VLDLRDELDTKSAQLGTSYPEDLKATYEAADSSLADATAAVQEQIDTADEVLAAVAADAANDGVFDQVGLIGTNLPELLDEATAALAQGDHDLARAKAQEVVDTVEKAPDVGKTRSLWAAGGAALFLLLVILLIVLVRRRTRRRRADLVQQNEGIVAGTENVFSVHTQPVEASGEESLRSDVWPDVAVEEIAEVDFAEDPTTDPATNSQG